MFAVVQYGNQQYKVSPDQLLKIDKVNVEEGKTFKTDQVLLINDKGLEVGKPFVSGAVCEAKVVKHGKLDKIRVFKMKAKKRYERTQGHRQAYTEIQIVKIGKGAVKKEEVKEKKTITEKPKAKKAEKKD